MTTDSQRLGKKIVAVIVTVSILGVTGLSPVVIIFFLGVGFLVWRAVVRVENQDTQHIFAFYISADEILRDAERKWYGFEIAEVIQSGERVIDFMPDPPPLGYFALGALYQRIGNYEATVERLVHVVEDDLSNEAHLTAPSPQLRRYVEMLRRIERQPAIAPQAMAAIRSLERARRKNALRLLAESRECLKTGIDLEKQDTAADRKLSNNDHKSATFSTNSPDTVTARPPICEVLQDIYREEKKTA